MRKLLLHPAAKPLVFVLCLLPLVWLVVATATNQLGANPAEALIRATGDWTLRALCLVLAVTPLRVLTATPQLARFRRMLGLFVFFYGLLHLLSSPGSQARLAQQAMAQAGEWVNDAVRSAAATAVPTEPTALGAAVAADARFADPTWQQWPWHGLAAASKAWEGWWTSASQLRGMQDHSREQMRFYGQQMLDAFSPSNWLATNPQALQAAWQSGGTSLLKGMGHAVDELRLRHGLTNLEAAAGQYALGAALYQPRIQAHHHSQPGSAVFTLERLQFADDLVVGLQVGIVGTHPLYPAIALERIEHAVAQQRRRRVGPARAFVAADQVTGRHHRDTR